MINSWPTVQFISLVTKDIKTVNIQNEHEIPISKTMLEPLVKSQKGTGKLKIITFTISLHHVISLYINETIHF